MAPSKLFGPSDAAGGTFDHMAPELFSQDARASKQADMFAFGMVVYEVIAGTSPFRRHRMTETPALILQGRRPPKPEYPAAIGFGQGTWGFAERCWDEDPARRPTARNSLEHFEHAAIYSKDVDPGPKVPVPEPVHPRPGSSSKNLCECRFFAQCLPSYKAPARLFDHSSANSRFQQATCSARVLTSNRAVPILVRLFRHFALAPPTQRPEGSPQSDV